MNSKQTAVEWLIDEIEKHYIINNGSLNPTVVMELKRQAKEMEREQIESAFTHGELFSADYFDVDKPNEDCNKNYYNQTFK